MQVIEKIKQTAVKVDETVQEAERTYLDKRSELGKKQKEKISQARKEYFQCEAIGGKSSLTAIEKKLGSYGIEIYNAHLPCANRFYSPVYDIAKFKAGNRIAYFDITRWVTDLDEKNMDKLVNVYQVLANERCNVALIYHRKKDGCTVTMAIANTGNSDMPNIVASYRERIIEAIYGNFPGAEIEIDNGAGIPKCLQDMVSYERNSETQESTVHEAQSVAVITNLATDKSQDFISQSMEKLLDGIVPEKKEQEYKLILLASPSEDAEEQKNRLYKIYNELAPYASWQESFSATDNTSVGAGSSLGGSVGVNFGVGLGVNFGKMANYNVTVGNNKGQTKTCTNYAVKHSLDLLEERVKRLEQCLALGMWKFAAYAVSESDAITKNVATMYLALTQGEESHMSKSAINFWHGTRDKEDAAVILETLKRIHHPYFLLSRKENEVDPNILLLPSGTDLCTTVSGKELVRAINFPRKSVVGFPVIESVSFGRETQKFSISNVIERQEATGCVGDGALEIGNIVHMYHAEQQKVKLDINSLTSHVFITGSTGTGKSNTIYQLLSGMMKYGKKVLVIEPAKGEYHAGMGNYCKTYGTNPRLTEILRLNPFSFPTGKGIKKPVHILEHIDRLTEIFNACWPMYAAMPAVLKDAIELAYVNKGWDLCASECYPTRFPTFTDLLIALPEVMRTSMYSQDTQSDYTGALVTRVKSLTNGINGLVLCADDELSNEELFDKNVIVDISRVGSSETKALLMGVLIMKLQEYHTSSSGMNQELQHITVIEEAHNLLRRATIGQEGANLQGKSVEMLTNSIAEMRTYGEGFIIADQAPGLLDEAVIRNTNTKIVLRLPDAGDRELVGRAAALNDAQINELAKLPRGVAAVYQNDWVEAVLCLFEKYESGYEPEETVHELSSESKPSETYFMRLFGVGDDKEMQAEKVDRIADWIDTLIYPTSTKTKMKKILNGVNLTVEEKQVVAYNLFDGKRIAKFLRDSVNSEEGIAAVDIRIQNRYNITNEQLVVTIRQLILQYIVEHVQTEQFASRYVDYIEGRQM